MMMHDHTSPTTNQFIFQDTKRRILACHEIKHLRNNQEFRGVFSRLENNQEFRGVFFFEIGERLDFKGVFSILNIEESHEFESLINNDRDNINMIYLKQVINLNKRPNFTRAFSLKDRSTNVNFLSLSVS